MAKNFARAFRAYFCYTTYQISTVSAASAQYLLDGREKGFRIGLDYSQHSYTPCRGNILSTLAHPQVVEDYLEHELEEGRITEITDILGIMGLHVSPFGVIPKKVVISGGSYLTYLAP